MTAHALAFLSIQPARFVLTLLQCTAAAQAVQQQQIFADALTGYVAECRVPIQKMVCDAFAAVIKHSRAPAFYKLPVKCQQQCVHKGLSSYLWGGPP